MTWPHVGHLIKESCLRASYTKSAPCLVRCSYIFCSWGYVFYLSRDPARLLHWGVMHIYGWELLATCHHSEKFGDHRHSDSSEEKCFIKNMNLITTYNHREDWVDWITARREKMSQPQKCTFWEKVPKNWKTKKLKILLLMTTFYIYLLK